MDNNRKLLAAAKSALDDLDVGGEQSRTFAEVIKQLREAVREIELAARKKKHLKNNGVCCLFCGSGDIEGNHPELGDGKVTVERNVFCHDCGAEWIDFYYISDVRIVEGPKLNIDERQAG